MHGAADADWGQHAPQVQADFRTGVDVEGFRSFTGGMIASLLQQGPGEFDGRAPQMNTFPPRGICFSQLGISDDVIGGILNTDRPAQQQGVLLRKRIQIPVLQHQSGEELINFPSFAEQFQLIDLRYFSELGNRQKGFKNKLWSIFADSSSKPHQIQRCYSRKFLAVYLRHYLVFLNGWTNCNIWRQQGQRPFLMGKILYNLPALDKFPDWSLIHALMGYWRWGAVILPGHQALGLRQIPVNTLHNPDMPDFHPRCRR